MLKTALALFTALATCSVIAADTVDFITNPGTMRPNSTFELRFSSPIVAAEQVNKPASTPPLIIQPALPGEFMWMSQSSGIFRPSAPPALSNTYVFTLAPDIKTADGKPFNAVLRRVIDTPPFQVTGSYPHGGSSNASALAGFNLLFNAPVDATKVGSLITYTDRSGLCIPAEISQTDPGHIAPYARPVSPRPNQFHVAPAKPLPPSSEWRLVVDAGLPAVEPGLKTLTPWSVSVGTVRPFIVSAVRAENTLSEKRRIILSLSKTPAKEVTAKSIERWVRIEPRPQNLTASIENMHWQGGSEVTFRGDFALHQSYRVTVCAGFPAVEGFVLPGDHDVVLKFDPIEPRLGFEDAHASQISSGNRKVQLLTINVPRVRVTAKAFTPDTAADAAQTYSRYFAYDHRKPDEMHKIDVGSLPGRTVFQQDYTLPARVDEPDPITLDWDKILGPGATGIALITAEALDVASGQEKPGSQTLIELTDLSVVWKDSISETFLHVFSLRSGQPIAGASLQLLDERNTIINETTTDATGVARLPNSKQAAYLLARSGSDLNLIRFQYREHISHHRFRVAWNGGEEDMDDEFDDQNALSRHVLMFTDRPVYKPGETCHLKGIVRDARPGLPALPEGQQATLETLDSRGKAFLSQKITISAAGSFTADAKLPSGPLGDYTWKLRFSGDKPPADDEDRRTGYDHAFAVQAYKPNAFEILIGQARREPGNSETVFDMRAKYYMGKPLSKAEVNWSIEAADTTFEPDGLDSFTFCDGAKWELSEAPSFSDSGLVAVAEDGTAAIRSRIPLNEKSPQPRQVGIRCEVTDVNQQTVSEAKPVTLHSSDFYLGIAGLPDVIREGESLPLQLIAVDSDGTPRNEPADVQVRLMRVDWQTNRVQGAGYSESYQSKPTLIPCAQVALWTQSLKKTPAGWVLANPGVRDVSLTVPQPGQYLIEATTKDSSGRLVLTTRMVYVHGRAVTVWNYRNPFQIEIVPDKTEYASGETATLLVKTPISGTALVTVEREHVRRSFLAKLEGNAPAVRVQLEPEDAPNVYVSVLMLRGTADSPKKFKMPEYRVGYCALPVQRRDSRLVMNVQPSRGAYRPGESVELRVEARTAGSKPVPGAEVTLYAVDEGILSLMGYETPDPYAFFNRRRPLGVATGLTLPDLKSENPGDRVFGNKGYLVGDGGESMSLRKNFLACAYWNASLRTDDAGQVTANFIAPDSLTRYRIIAIVVTAADQFGSAAGAFEVNKPVMIEPAPPRFGNVGDRIIVRSVIHNTTSLEGDAEVRLVLDSTARSAEPLTARVHLKPGTSVPVDFPVEFVSVGEAVWKFTVDFASGATAYHDEVESRLKVGFPAPLLRQIVQGRAAAGETEMLAAIDPALLNGHGMVRVSLSNSRVVELRESLSQLLHYPYGCVEQTTSSTLPWLSLRGMGGALPEFMRPESEVKRAIQHGVDRLLSMQTESGGLAYWPGGREPLLYASAWGGFGIASARKAGAEVPEADFKRLMDYLAGCLRGAGGATDVRDASSQCLALFTLAVGGHPQPAYHELFFNKRNQLDAQQRAWLALAILESKGAAFMVETLLTETPLAQDDTVWWWCSSRTTSTQLMAWTRHRPRAQSVDRLVSQLLSNRKNGHWYTTQGNAWAVLALGEFVERVERAQAETSGEFAFNGERRSFRLGEKGLCQTMDFPFTPGMTPNLTLSHSGTGPVFTDVTVETQPAQMPPARSDSGYSIRRSYQKILDDGSLAESKDLRVGDRVLITLDVTVPRRAEYLAIEDPLPSVFEAINPDFKSQATAGAKLASPPWGCDFRELRENRALFFVDHSYQGEHTIRYLARVRAAGAATAPPAKIEEMYDPDRFATSDTRSITSKKWD